MYLIFFNLQILPLSLSFSKSMFVEKLRQVELQSFLVWISLVYIFMMNLCIQLDPEASSDFSWVLQACTWVAVFPLIRRSSWSDISLMIVTTKAQCFVCSVAQSCLTLCDSMDCSPPGSSVHGIFQARVLEWGAIVFSILQ